MRKTTTLLIMKTTTIQLKLIGSQYHIFRISQKNSKTSSKIKM